MLTSRKAGDRGSLTAVVEWLLEPDQPAVRYLALRDLLDRPETDRDVRAARARIGRVGWAADQFRTQGAEGFWEKSAPRTLEKWIDFLYFPPYLATNWRALLLSDLGLTSQDPRIRKVADRIFEFKLRLGSPFNYFHEETCIAGNTARILTRFGYGDDRRVQMLFDWLIEDQRKDGGWSCSQGAPGTLDAWEALAAFAAVPPSRRSARMRRAIERGAEFYLARRLFREGPRYAPWFRFHFPTHYFYDILLGLDLLTDLGYASDRRLAPALKILKRKRRSDGRWILDRLHPDVGPGIQISSRPKEVRALEIEPAGRPSKWITLRALTVLQRVGDLPSVRL